MPSPTKKSATETRKLERRIAALERLVDRMSDEIRTKRVVVVEDDGFERVVVSSNSAQGPNMDGAAVTVYSRDGDHENYVRLYASELAGEGYTAAELFVVGAGNTATTLGYFRTDDGVPLSELAMHKLDVACGIGVIVDSRGVHTER